MFFGGLKKCCFWPKIGVTVTEPTEIWVFLVIFGKQGEKRGLFLQVLSINSLSNLGFQEEVFLGVKMKFFGCFWMNYGKRDAVFGCFLRCFLDEKA